MRPFRTALAAIAAFVTLTEAQGDITICKPYHGYLDPDKAHSMTVTESTRSGGTGMNQGGVYLISQTWKYLNKRLPDYHDIEVSTLKESNSDKVSITLADRSPPHHIVFQLTRHGSDRASYIISGPDNDCTIQYSGFGSELLDVAAYTV